MTLLSEIIHEPSFGRVIMEGIEERGYEDGVYKSGILKLLVLWSVKGLLESREFGLACLFI